MINPTLVTKASGDTVPFSEDRLRRSLQKAGASQSIINDIVSEVNDQLYEHITTKKIYHIAFNLLKKKSGPLAARYHLKKAIMELGPSGFPFEKFIAEILKWEGYETQTDVISHGKCVSHEVDVIAQKNNEYIMVECKYHNKPGLFCDVKIPLYVKSRFIDLETAWKAIPGRQEKIYSGWLVTNTRFSLDAVQYGTCAGLKLLSWDFPVKNGIKDQIDRLGLYPITCLTTLTKLEKQKLLDNKIVLCHELNQDAGILLSIGVKKQRMDSVMNEVKLLCEQLIKNGNGK
jgi:hypothetical protein